VNYKNAVICPGQPHVTVSFKQTVLAVLFCQGEGIGPTGGPGIIHRQSQAAEMRDCLRNGLADIGRTAQIGRKHHYIDARYVPEPIGTFPQLRRVAGKEAKMHILSGKFGGDSGP
jgi:hypothetical protein